MRMVVVLVSLAATSAFAAPAKTCRVTIKGNGFDVGCLPALSAKGTLVAVPAIDPDGDRGLPNLEVSFVPVDGSPPAATVVLTVEEAEAAGGRLAGAQELIEPRLDLVNAQLWSAGFVSLRPAGAAREASVQGERLEVRGPGIATESVALSLPAATCTDATVGGVWATADGRALVVRVDYACPDARAVWRVMGTRNAPSLAQPVAVQPAQLHPAEASTLNTRGMRKFRARDWFGAAADFRAAIERNADHVKAHYNLACLASITGDRATVLEQLRWLAASELPDAQQRMVKARTDPDMRFVRDDPEVREILDRHSTRSAAIGLSRAARRAGIHEASTAAAGNAAPATR